MKFVSKRTVQAICSIPPEKLAEKKIVTTARTRNKKIARDDQRRRKGYTK
ncbi:MAG: hypothetical protein IJ774_09980 [Selenomonadaceae bacterium]|nr:hypothetical protein [Selenomonadaceae bacterium]